MINHQIEIISHPNVKFVFIWIDTNEDNLEISWLVWQGLTHWLCYKSELLVGADVNKHFIINVRLVFNFDINFTELILPPGFPYVFSVVLILAFHQLMFYLVWPHRFNIINIYLHIIIIFLRDDFQELRWLRIYNQLFIISNEFQEQWSFLIC